MICMNLCSIDYIDRVAYSFEWSAILGELWDILITHTEKYDEMQVYML